MTIAAVAATTTTTTTSTTTNTINATTITTTNTTNATTNRCQYKYCEYVCPRWLALMSYYSTVVITPTTAHYFYY